MALTPPMLISLHKPTFQESLFQSITCKRVLKLMLFQRHMLKYFYLLSNYVVCYKLYVGIQQLGCHVVAIESLHNACTCIYLFKAFKTIGCGLASSPCLRRLLAPINLVDNTINQ